MANFEDRLKKEIQLFIILLKKMKEREAADNNMGFLSQEEQQMLKSLDFVIMNYENMETHFPLGYTGEMMESFSQMLHYLTPMLMEELGDSGVYLTDEEQLIYNEVHSIYNEEQGKINIDKSLPIPSMDQLLEKTDAAIPMKHRLMMAIQDIDQQITPDIDGALVDELLDRRLELLDELKRFS
jgi:hypothetical protein